MGGGSLIYTNVLETPDDELRRRLLLARWISSASDLASIFSEVRRSHDPADAAAAGRLKEKVAPGP